MNYQEMSDTDISRAVGDIFKKDWANLGNYFNPLYFWLKGELEIFDPCNSWADAGPIIQESRIDIMAAKNGMNWMAHAFNYAISNIDKNPLRAAMIVFLMIKGGE